MKKMILLSMLGLSPYFTSAQHSTDFNVKATGNISPYSYKAEPSDSTLPFWKRFSIEAAIGRSSYGYRAAETGDSMGALFIDRSFCRHSLDARLGLNYHFDNGLSLQTGVEYSEAHEHFEFSTSTISSYTYQDTVSVYYDPTLMDSVYVISPVSFTTTFYIDKLTENYFKLLTVPFQLAWKTNASEKSEFEFSLGGAVTVYGKNTGITTEQMGYGTIPTSEAYRTKGILSLGGSIKYLQRFGLHHALYIEPWARLGITSLSMPVLLYAVRRDHYGIRVGYRFYFDSRKHN